MSITLCTDLIVSPLVRKWLISSKPIQKPNTILDLIYWIDYHQVTVMVDFWQKILAELRSHRARPLGVCKETTDPILNQISDICLSLRALLEQVDNLKKFYFKTWILSNYRVGNLQPLANDLEVYLQKLQIQTNLLQQFEIHSLYLDRNKQ